jgi:hypothetical protein
VVRALLGKKELEALVSGGAVRPDQLTSESRCPGGHLEEELWEH